jgi:hypothetical protein
MLIVAMAWWFNTYFFIFVAVTFATRFISKEPHKPKVIVTLFTTEWPELCEVVLWNDRRRGWACSSHSLV